MCTRTARSSSGNGACLLPSMPTCPTNRPRRFKRTGKRSEIFLATKFGMRSTVPGRTVLGDPEFVPEAFDRSIRRLGVDSVELYYLHR